MKKVEDIKFRDIQVGMSHEVENFILKINFIKDLFNKHSSHGNLYRLTFSPYMGQAIEDKIEDVSFLLSVEKSQSRDSAFDTSCNISCNISCDTNFHITCDRYADKASHNNSNNNSGINIRNSSTSITKEDIYKLQNSRPEVFKSSTREVFYTSAELDNYKILEKPEPGCDKVRFRQGMYNSCEKYMEIIEHLMVSYFLDQERKSSFQEKVENLLKDQ